MILNQCSTMFCLPRSGNVVLMKLPGLRADAGTDIGLVMTVWRGVKDPRPCATEVPIKGCVAFRAISLSMTDPCQDCLPYA